LDKLRQKNDNLIIGSPQKQKKKRKEKKTSTMHNLIQPPDTTHINGVPYKGQRKD
jgi:hypothetical protein